ncbi:cysteine desulfurase family protein [Bacillus testis]|uniref:cysteine desulfurase family protein n=1 Tax=Bacillus testis TaxID=1622072 RepID=UPI00067F47F8|nr:cysteine desulfurase family protein [Bacillus testis]
MERIYLDHAATTPVHQDVVREVMSVMEQTYGNPSSIHAFGREARKTVNDARKVLARTIGAKENEIIFTSGGTEADNQAIIGVAMERASEGKHMITTVIEHHAVLHTFEHLEKLGFEVTYLPVDEQGRISIDELKQALREDTILVSVMFGNNEVGTIQDIGTIGALVRESNAYFHSDAVQAYGVVPISVNDLHIDLLSVSSHKINGPKGIGFLYCREGVAISSVLYGGEQERKRRAGTENVPAIAGFAKAAEIIQNGMEQKNSQLLLFKQTMCDILAERGIAFEVNGSSDHCLPHVCNLSFPGTHVEALLANLDLAGIAASSGSACTAGSINPSHVLVAMYGKDSEKISNSIRFSFGMNNTLQQIEKAAHTTADIINRLTK